MTHDRRPGASLAVELDAEPLGGEAAPFAGVGDRLLEGAVRNPVIVLANYFFDGVPQDTFLVREGQLYENLVTLCSTQEEPDLGDPALLSRARLAYERCPGHLRGRLGSCRRDVGVPAGFRAMQPPNIIAIEHTRKE